MKLFRCDYCENIVFFENVRCVRCQHTLGFLTDVGTISALKEAGDGHWRALASEAKGRHYRQCGNGAQFEACNWLISAESKETHCPSCRLNSLIPDLKVVGNLDRWRKIELAKRRVLYTLQGLGMPSDGRELVPVGPELRFQMVGAVIGKPPPLTGHDHGVITLNVAEADDDERERRRIRFREPYRTLVGHLRHELAHYYWELLLSRSKLLEDFRVAFGDERADYAEALKRYYQDGPIVHWQEHYVSAYASAHPWEDWAETFAHYLHITDSLQTAANFGMVVNPPASRSFLEKSYPLKAVRHRDDFDRIMQHWPPLACAINELNRGMGLQDLYPFVIAPPVVEKLAFVHELFRLVNLQVKPHWWLRTFFGPQKVFQPVLPVSQAQAA